MGQLCLCESLLFFRSISRCLTVDLHSTSISLCLDEGFHFDATLENWVLRFLSHIARSISRCLKNLNFNFAFHNSPGCTFESSIGDRFTLLETKLIGFNFATTSSYAGFLSCINLLDMVLVVLIGLNWLQKDS